MRLALLSECFPPYRIRWRVGARTKDKSKGMGLAYLDARDVTDRLDNVCGPANWQDRYTHAGQKTCCEIGIRINGEWIWKSDGAGDTDIEGNKGAFSDAFKRAGVKWGIGRYLYSSNSPWVALDERGNFTKGALEELTNSLYPPNGKDTLHGPLKKTELQAEMRAIAGQIPDIATTDELDHFITSWQPITDQCARDQPTWYYGVEGSDVIGYLGRIEDRRYELMQGASK